MNNLLNLDISILLYIRDSIKPIINFNLKEYIVPIIYANQLKWNMIKTNNYLINSLGKIDCPLISIRRSSLSTSSYLANRRLFIDNYQRVYAKPFQKPRLRDVVNGKINTQLYILTNVPTYLDVLYLINYWTNYISHKNIILLYFLLHNSIYWNGYKTSITSMMLLPVSLLNSDRVIKSTISIKVLCKILTDHSLNLKYVDGILKIMFELTIL